MQRIVGTGKVFLNADGVLIQRSLAVGEKIRVSSGNIAAYQSSVKLKLERVKGFANIFFSGEALFMSTMEGPGMELQLHVCLQCVQWRLIGVERRLGISTALGGDVGRCPG